MIDLDKYPETVKVPLYQLEPGMVLAEPVRFPDGLAAGVGYTLLDTSANILRDTSGHPNVLRVEGKQRGDPIEVYDFGTTEQRGRDMIKDFGRDVKIVESMSSLVQKLREGQLNIARSIDERVKVLVGELAESEAEFGRYTEAHKRLGRYLSSRKLNEEIHRNLIDPLLVEDPVANVYLSYSGPDTYERALDVTNLAAAICIVAGIIPRPVIKPSFLNNIGEVGLRRKLEPETMAYKKLWPFRDLVLAEQILRPEWKFVDGLEEGDVEAVKHRLTRRDGREVRTIDGEKLSSIFIGNGMRTHDVYDINDAVRKRLAEHAATVKREGLTTDNIFEVPTIYNEPIHLAVFFTTLMTQSRTRLNALKICKTIQNGRGLIAREDLVDAFVEVVGKKYFPG